MDEVDSVALFDSLAGRYDQVLPVFRALGERLVDSLCILRGERLLDVGCGRGAVALAAAALGAEVVAIDAASEMARLLKTEAPDLVVEVMDARNLAIKDSSFDTAVAAFVLNVVGNQIGVVGEMARVVRPGGRVVLGLPGPADASWEPFFELFARFTPRTDVPRTAQPADGSQLARECGLVEIETKFVAIDLPVQSPAQVWEQSMSHGFAGYVASLSDRDRDVFKQQALSVLGEMSTGGSLRMARSAELTIGRVP